MSVLSGVGAKVNRVALYPKQVLGTVPKSAYGGKALASRKAVRNFYMKEAMGQQYKINSPERSKELQKNMTDLAAARKKLIQDWSKQCYVSVDRNVIEKKWRKYSQGKPGAMTNLVRNRLITEGFQNSAGNGKFRPYYIDGGILRGGMTAHGRESNGMYGIPISPGDSRVLTSLQAKYSNPAMFPMTRIIKFIRGRWGISPTSSQFEGVWPGEKRRRFETVEIKNEDVEI